MRMHRDVQSETTLELLFDEMRTAGVNALHRYEGGRFTGEHVFYIGARVVLTAAKEDIFEKRVSAWWHQRRGRAGSDD
jgi:hypothetical protein